MVRFSQFELEAYEARRREAKASTQQARQSSRKATTLREAVIQEAIAAYLNGLGLDCYFVWHRMDKPTTCRAGTPDFTGWILGKPFALEVKRPGKKETREQAGELLRCQLAGAVVAVVHSISEAVLALAPIVKEPKKT